MNLDIQFTFHLRWACLGNELGTDHHKGLSYATCLRTVVPSLLSSRKEEKKFWKINRKIRLHCLWSWIVHHVTSWGIIKTDTTKIKYIIKLKKFMVFKVNTPNNIYFIQYMKWNFAFPFCHTSLMSVFPKLFCPWTPFRLKKCAM